MIFHGTIISVDKNNGIYSYLVEENGKIVFVGNDLPKKFIGQKVVELEKGAIMPTFADTHGHFASFSMLAGAVKMQDAPTNYEKLAILKEADLTTKKGKSLFCFGASPYVKEGRFLNKYDIDSVVKNRAVAIVSTDGHTIILNQKAIDKMPKSIKNIDGYCDDGVIGKDCFFKVIDNILKIINPLDGLKSFQKAFDEYCQKGFGIIAAQTGMGMPFDIDTKLLKWVYGGQDSGVQMRFFIQSFDVEKAKKLGVKRLGGCFETALDGSVTSCDASFSEPYLNTTNYGKLFYDDEDLYNKIKKINDSGITFQMHAIGDRAVTQATNVYKRVLGADYKNELRHGIIHASYVKDEAMDIIEKYHLQIQGQPAFIEMDSENSQSLIEKLGKERCEMAEPHSEFIKRGVIFSAGSDCPVTFPNGVKWLHLMVNNPNVKHRLSLTDAIRVATYNGYYATFDEKERGSLEVGKICDMIVLDKNPYDVEDCDIKNIKVTDTYYAGKKWAPKDVGIVKTILKGMTNKNIIL